MKIDPVKSVPSSIFRNTRQYLHSNELFYRLTDEGNYNRFMNQERNRKQNGRGYQRGHRKPNRVVNKHSKGILMKGLQLYSDSMMLIQNRLVEYSNNITNAHNKRIYIRSYRSSI